MPETLNSNLSGMQRLTKRLTNPVRQLTNTLRGGFQAAQRVVGGVTALYGPQPRKAKANANGSPIMTDLHEFAGTAEESNANTQTFNWNYGAHQGSSGLGQQQRPLFNGASRPDILGIQQKTAASNAHMQDIMGGKSQDMRGFSLESLSRLPQFQAKNANGNGIWPWSEGTKYTQNLGKGFGIAGKYMAGMGNNAQGGAAQMNQPWFQKMGDVFEDIRDLLEKILDELKKTHKGSDTGAGKSKDENGTPPKPFDAFGLALFGPALAAALLALNELGPGIRQLISRMGVKVNEWMDNIRDGIKEKLNNLKFNDDKPGKNAPSGSMNGSDNAKTSSQTIRGRTTEIHKEPVSPISQILGPDGRPIIRSDYISEEPAAEATTTSGAPAPKEESWWSKLAKNTAKGTFNAVSQGIIKPVGSGTANVGAWLGKAGLGTLSTAASLWGAVQSVGDFGRSGYGFLTGDNTSGIGEFAKGVGTVTAFGGPATMAKNLYRPFKGTVDLFKNVASSVSKFGKSPMARKAMQLGGELTADVGTGTIRGLAAAAPAAEATEIAGVAVDATGIGALGPGEALGVAGAAEEAGGGILGALSGVGKFASRFTKPAMNWLKKSGPGFAKGLGKDLAWWTGGNLISNFGQHFEQTGGDWMKSLKDDISHPKEWIPLMDKSMSEHWKDIQNIGSKARDVGGTALNAAGTAGKALGGWFGNSPWTQLMHEFTNTGAAQAAEINPTSKSSGATSNTTTFQISFHDAKITNKDDATKLAKQIIDAVQAKFALKASANENFGVASSPWPSTG